MPKGVLYPRRRGILFTSQGSRRTPTFLIDVDVALWEHRITLRDAKDRTLAGRDTTNGEADEKVLV